jgi:guanine nucleotide-binding protein subunit alpha
MRLLPLTATEDSLASELCGGALIAKGGSGFVRAGWQTLVRSGRSWPANQSSYMDGAPAVSSLTMKTLAMVQDDIEDLWRHPAVKFLLKQRTLTLQESAALWDFSYHYISQLIYLSQFSRQHSSDSSFQLHANYR